MRFPPQVPYIIGNEGCERFSFYGMRNILTPFLVTSLLLYLPEPERAGAAKDVFHTFVIGVYLFPLLGGWLADRFFGKYDTIFWFSLVYCAGHACLAIFEDDRHGFYAGLGLIAFASGGIKPCVSSFVGDQFDRSQRHVAKVVFDAFYWIINFGSFFASLLMPIFLREFGAVVAFGIPGILMGIATLVFRLGRKHYVIVPPSPPDRDSFLRVCRTALLATAPGSARRGFALACVGFVAAAGVLALTPKLGIVITFCLAMVIVIGFGGGGAWLQLDRARGVHPEAAVEGVRAVLRLLLIFALVTPFWSLFDQKASTWVLQANDMTRPDWFHPAQMQALNPALVMLLIPFNNLVLYPALARRGYAMTGLRRMTTGMIAAGFSWICAGVFQVLIDGGDPMSIAWQILPYALLTFGEVLVSAGGLEFVYSQAPASMKGTIMSLWFLGVTTGNLWVLVANATVRDESVLGFIAGTGLSSTAFLMFFFAGFAFLAALPFGLYARRYREVDHYREAPALS
ncbi:MAG TPA: oligopeptide:H+ symporter [Nevskiaceae bacterium]|nr:oligopeptide:H+ symporter [Nevskiaceae bacterium]